MCEVAMSDAEIDTLVHELYGITEITQDECTIVEGTQGSGHV